MTDERPEPTSRPIPQPDLSNPSSVSQQQNPKVPPPPVTPDQVPSSGGGLQKIVAYFESQGAPPDQVIATIAGMPLKLSDLKASSPTPPPPKPPSSPPPAQEDEFKP